MIHTYISGSVCSLRKSDMTEMIICKASGPQTMANQSADAQHEQMCKPFCRSPGCPCARHCGARTLLRMPEMSICRFCGAWTVLRTPNLQGFVAREPVRKAMEMIISGIRRMAWFARQRIVRTDTSSRNIGNGNASIRGMDCAPKGK